MGLALRASPIHHRKDGVLKVRTCAWSPPGDHPVGCGMFIHVKDGKIVKVEGDPSHPITQGRLCPRCIALDEVVYHKDRLLSPMKRAREDRGKDAWEKISWDEAYDLLEEKHPWFSGKLRCRVHLHADGHGSRVHALRPGVRPCYHEHAERCIDLPVLGRGVLRPARDHRELPPGRRRAGNRLCAVLPRWLRDDPRWVARSTHHGVGRTRLYSSPDGFFGLATASSTS